MDWIKVDTNLYRKGETIRLARILGISALEAAGACVAFWGWADGETEDGFLDGHTPDVVDHVVGRDGFADALIKVGWLLKDDRRLVIPNFDRHNGESAKKRLLDAERQRERRRRAKGDRKGQ